MEEPSLALPALWAAIVVAVAAALYPPLAWLDRWGQRAPGEPGRPPLSLLLPFAFALKLLSKRAALSSRADRLLHAGAPILALAALLLLLGALPPGPDLVHRERAEPLGVLAGYSSLPLALGLLALSSAGIALAGVGGGNSLALLGALRLLLLRLVAHLSLTVAALGPALLAGSLSLDAIVRAQGRELFLGVPALGALANPAGFLAALVGLATLAQHMARGRPDEQADLIEPVAIEAIGPVLLAHRLLEVIDLFAGSALLACLFLGGWLVPFVDGAAFQAASLSEALLRVLVFLGKIGVAAVLLVLLRRSLPPLRHDHAMALVWLLVLLAAAGLALTAGVVAPLAG